jgi:hypothetical protein
VGAALDHPAGLHHQDLVCIHDLRGYTMSAHGAHNTGEIRDVRC